MCIPRDPLVLGQPRRPISSRIEFTSSATARTSCPTDAGARIEIDAQLVRMIEVGGSHRMRMQLDTTEIDDPRQPCIVVDHDFFRGASRWERECDSSEPRRALRRCAFLVECLAVGAVDVSLEDDRTVADSSERAGRDRQVVADQVKFRELDLFREVQLAWIADADLVSVDREQLGGIFFRHNPSLQIISAL